MRLTKKKMEQENIISDRSIRDKCVGRYEVLEKVKKLLLLPGTDLMSIDQVADFYEVSSQGIKNLYSQNKEEIDGDGTKMLPRDFYNGSNEKSISVDIKQTSVTYTFEDGQIVTINNRGLKAFSKRAVLRIGRDCKKSCVYRGNFFSDMNQICKNLLSDSVIFMLSNFLYSHSITSSYVYIHLFSFFCIPIRH